MRKSIQCKTVAFTLAELRELKEYIIGLKYPHIGLIEISTLWEAIQALEAWDKLLQAHNIGYLKERETAFKAMNKMKKAFSGMLCEYGWNRLCLLVAFISNLRKLDDLRY